MSRELFNRDPERAKRVVQAGRLARVGHDRERWKSVDWDDYKASVGIGNRRGPWHVTMAEMKPDTPDDWMSEAMGLPFKTGWYTILEHAERGLVMSDVPGEIAGCLPFLDRVKAGPDGQKILIGGLGLGIVPRWLLANTAVASIDVVEFDEDIIRMILDDGCVQDWADERLRVHHGDILTWPVELPDLDATGERWDAAWFDIWDLVSPENLPSMAILSKVYRERAAWLLCWEQPECEAMAQRWLDRQQRPLSVRGDDLGIVGVAGNLTVCSMEGSFGQETEADSVAQ